MDSKTNIMKDQTKPIYISRIFFSYCITAGGFHQAWFWTVWGQL